jgi:hypothetical protein
LRQWISTAAFCRSEVKAEMVETAAMEVMAELVEMV